MATKRKPTKKAGSNKSAAAKGVKKGAKKATRKKTVARKKGAKAGTNVIRKPQ